jgi:NAD(P)-dependent dehydrogenase (short-subunit alcohol dehydrogenase family)
VDRLKGKRALITGAASGIGRATALRFTAEGAEVAPFGADITVEEEVAAAFDAAVAEMGGLDVVVANAAIQLFGSDARVHELDTDVWDRTIAVNLRGTFLTCKYGVRALLSAGGGSLICTGSPTGMFGGAPDFTAYSASKAGVHGMARAIANGYAAQGIRCNVVVPGFTATPLVASILDDPHETARVLSTVPMCRPGTPEEVASAMVYLASDEASYVTGAMFTVDGGQTAI